MKATKRRIVNDILWPIMSLGTYLFIYYTWNDYMDWIITITAIIFSILGGRVIVILINAYIFNWLFKKKFDKWFQD